MREGAQNGPAPPAFARSSPRSISVVAKTRIFLPKDEEKYMFSFCSYGSCECLAGQRRGKELNDRNHLKKDTSHGTHHDQQRPN